jgi:hypothetical protein
VRDRTVEQMFLAIYSMPALQAVVGIRTSDESAPRQPGLVGVEDRWVSRTGGPDFALSTRMAPARAHHRLEQTASNRGGHGEAEENH